jgi:hypothetical protein
VTFFVTSMRRKEAMARVESSRAILPRFILLRTPSRNPKASQTVRPRQSTVLQKPFDRQVDVAHASTIINAGESDRPALLSANFAA